MSTTTKDKIRDWFSEVDFDFQSVPGTEAASEFIKTLMESTLIKVITGLIVNLCAAAYSLKELYDYFLSQQYAKEKLFNVGPNRTGFPHAG